MRRFDCRAVLFDLDGVLVDSTAAIEQEWRVWAARRGVDPDAVLRVAHGRRGVDTIRLVAPELDAEAEMRALLSEPRVPAPALAHAGAARLLCTLPAGSWAVVTSANRDHAAERLASAGLPVPEVIVGADSVRRGKPEPEGFLRAAEALGVPREECVVVEDSPAGVAAGRTAGMTVVAVLSTHAPEALAIADAWVATLGHLHIGRMDGDGAAGRSIELLVVEP